MDNTIPLLITPFAILSISLALGATNVVVNNVTSTDEGTPGPLKRLIKSKSPIRFTARTIKRRLMTRKLRRKRLRKNQPRRRPLRNRQQPKLRPKRPKAIRRPMPIVVIKPPLTTRRIRVGRRQISPRQLTKVPLQIKEPQPLVGPPRTTIQIKRMIKIISLAIRPLGQPGRVPRIHKITTIPPRPNR